MIRKAGIARENRAEKIFRSTIREALAKRRGKQIKPESVDEGIFDHQDIDLYEQLEDRVHKDDTINIEDIINLFGDNGNPDEQQELLNVLKEMVENNTNSISDILNTIEKLKGIKCNVHQGEEAPKDVESIWFNPSTGELKYNKDGQWVLISGVSVGSVNRLIDAKLEYATTDDILNLYGL